MIPLMKQVGAIFEAARQQIREEFAAWPPRGLEDEDCGACGHRLNDHDRPEGTMIWCLRCEGMVDYERAGDGCPWEQEMAS